MSLWVSLTLLFTLMPVAAQHRVETIAGGKVPSGVPATNVEVNLNGPAGMDARPNGTVIFADNLTNTIRRILPGGTIETVAGTGNSGFAPDGRRRSRPT